jgi:hypothetical protein
VIYNGTGQLVYQSAYEADLAKSEIRIPVNDLRAGCYSVSVISPDGIGFTSRFIKL